MGIEDIQPTDITQITIWPIFEFTYSSKNEYCSGRSESRFINNETLNIPIIVFLKF